MKVAISSAIYCYGRSYNNCYGHRGDRLTVKIPEYVVSVRFFIILRQLGLCIALNLE